MVLSAWWKFFKATHGQVVTPHHKTCLISIKSLAQHESVRRYLLDRKTSLQSAAIFKGSMLSGKPSPRGSP